MGVSLKELDDMVARDGPDSSGCGRGVGSEALSGCDSITIINNVRLKEDSWQILRTTCYLSYEQKRSDPHETQLDY